MPVNNLNNLLGFKDFAEALFAQSQALDTVQTAAYGPAEQSKVAELAEAVNQLQRSATVSGLQVVVPPDKVITANYLGVPDPAGQFPFEVEIELTQLGLDLLGDPRTSVVFTPNGFTGSEISNGVFEVTGMTKQDASLLIEIVFAGVSQGQWLYKATTQKAAPPPPVVVVVTPPPPTPPPPPPPAPQTPAASVYLTPPNSSAFNLAGTLEVVGGFTYEAILSSSFSTAFSYSNPSNIEVYIASRPAGGSWTQQGAIVTGSPNEFFSHYEDPDSYYRPRAYYRDQTEQTPGFVSLSRTIVLPAGTYEIGFFIRLLYGPVVGLSDPAIVQPA